MSPERERWAIALLLEREHGPRADAFVDERIAALAAAGDCAGVSRWQAIAASLEALRGNNVSAA